MVDRYALGVKIGISATYMWSSSSFQNAGISRYSRCLLDALFRLPGGDEYEVFTNDSFEPPADWGARENVRVHPVVPDRRGGRAAWDMIAATKAIRETGVEAWFATAHATPFRSPVPRVAMIHDMIPITNPEYQNWKQSAYLKWALRYASRHPERVVTNSEATKAEIVRLVGVSPDKIAVTPLGPGNEIAPMDPATARVDAPFPRFFFTLGTLEPRKNVPVLFEALSLLKRQGRLGDLGLVVGGGRGWKEAGIFESLERLGVADRVHFAGYVPDADLPALFARCEAFVYPSLAEGFGMPVLEAMLAGAPTLTSKGTAMEEVAGDAAAGYFDPRDPASVAESLVAPRSREEWARKGLARAAEFTWERCARLTRQAISDAAGGR